MFVFIVLSGLKQIKWTHVLDSCPVKALMYIDNNLRSDLTNSCAVYNYVVENFDCIDLPGSEQPQNPHHLDIDDDWKDDTSINGPAEDGPYDEYLRKPIWWYHTDHLGSSTYLTDYFERPSHYYETLPFGEMMVEHNQSANVQSGVGYDNKFKFNGKELDDFTQMYYYGARYYDPRISIFVSVDPLAEKFVGWTPYHYVHNNPINLIDPTGMSAEGSGPPVKPGFLLTPIYKTRTYSYMGTTHKSKDIVGYKFRPSAVHLLSLVSGVKAEYIKNAKVEFGRFGVPGNSITTGSGLNDATITHYPKEGVNAVDPMYTLNFLIRNAHEVGHIPHLKDGNEAHMDQSILEYTLNLLYTGDWHDGPFSFKEKEADVGEDTLRDFNDFVNEYYGKNFLKKLFENTKNTEEDKIKRIDTWWKKYREERPKIKIKD